MEFSRCNCTFSYKQIDVTGSPYFDRRCGTTALPWIIAGSLVGAIIDIGILISILLKILLLASVSQTVMLCRLIDRYGIYKETDRVGREREGKEREKVGRERVGKERVREIW